VGPTPVGPLQLSFAPWLKPLVTPLHTCIRDRQRQGGSERCSSAIFPVESWNHFETASEGIARTTNSIEGWHYGIHALFSELI